MMYVGFSALCREKVEAILLCRVISFWGFSMLLVYIVGGFDCFFRVACEERVCIAS